MTAYIRTLDGVTMVHLAPHIHINAAFAMRERMPIDGRHLTPWRVAAMTAAAERGDVVAEAA